MAYNLAAALIATTAGRIALSGKVDLTALGWMLGVPALMYSGSTLLSLLDDEG
ncbi:hypothetical protein [Sphingomonas sp.]|uniref:hypothetical protein n=1 Tax=Sphingomonas sp. TaxID=28214 RepID=UPI003B3AB4A6